MEDSTLMRKFKSIKPHVPPELAKSWHELDKPTQYLILQQSVSNQQNEFLAARICEGDDAFDALRSELRSLKAEVASLQSIRDELKAKGSVVSLGLKGVVAILMIILSAWIGAYINARFDDHDIKPRIERK